MLRKFRGGELLFEGYIIQVGASIQGSVLNVSKKIVARAKKNPVVVLTKTNS